MTWFEISPVPICASDKMADMTDDTNIADTTETKWLIIVDIANFDIKTYDRFWVLTSEIITWENVVSTSWAYVINELSITGYPFC